MKYLLSGLALSVATLSLYGQPKTCFNTEEPSIHVLIFLATDCPISQKYIPGLNSIRNRYQGRNVVLQSIVPSSGKGQLKKFRNEYNITFPIRIDRAFQCVKAVGAQATPEVFVFDVANVLRYRGAIDNWFYDLGEYRQQSTENYLVDAIDSLLAGEDPPRANTTPIGCPIHTP